MRPKTRLFLWIGGGLFAAGLLLCTVVLMIGGFDFMKAASTERYTDRTLTVSPSDLKALQLDVENQRVILRPGSGADVLVHYREYENDTYTATQEEGVFTLTHRVTARWHSFLTRGILGGLSRIGQEVVVEVPAAFAADLDVRTSNASVQAAGLPKLQAARFSSANGSITLSGLQIADVTASTTNASVRLEGVTGGRAAVSTSNGSITLNGVKLTGDLTAGTTNASLTVQGTQAAGMSLRTTNGSITLSGVAADGQLEAETTSGAIRIRDCAAAGGRLDTRNAAIQLEAAAFSGAVTARTTNGSVRVERLDCPDIRLESTNGSIRGSIVGSQSEFSIVTTTTNGSASPSSVLNQQAEKKLEAVTTNAGIKLEFVG